MNNSSDEFVVPGSLLGSAAEFSAGPGVHSVQGSLFASLVGNVRKFPLAAINSKASAAPALCISVVPAQPLPPVPQPGDLVTARVLKINSRQAICEIILINRRDENNSNIFLPSPFPSIIRQRDIRAFEVDSIVVSDSFRPSDLVRALVLSLGDSKNYFLSTAANNLGVILAYSHQSVPMIPISWELMECPVTKVREKRKVAKPEGKSENSDKIEENSLQEDKTENEEENDENIPVMED